MNEHEKLLWIHVYAACAATFGAEDTADKAVLKFRESCEKFDKLTTDKTLDAFHKELRKQIASFFSLEQGKVITAPAWSTEKIRLIRYVRNVLAMSLKDAKDLVEGIAQDIREDLIEAG